MAEVIAQDEERLMRRFTPPEVAHVPSQRLGNRAPANEQGARSVGPVSASSANSGFGVLASDEQVASTQQALNANNIETVVVDSAAEAREYVLSLLPEGP